MRQHWAIQNRLHQVLDTDLAEDAQPYPPQSRRLACLRHLALNLLRSNGERIISQALWRNVLSLDRGVTYTGVREM